MFYFTFPVYIVSTNYFTLFYLGSMHILCFKHKYGKLNCFFLLFLFYFILWYYCIFPRLFCFFSVIYYIGNVLFLLNYNLTIFIFVLLFLEFPSILFCFWLLVKHTWVSWNNNPFFISRDRPNDFENKIKQNLFYLNGHYNFFVRYN